MPVPISNLSAIFADSTKAYVGLGLNVSYTAAATGSRLFELKVNNEPKFWIGLNGIPSTNLSTIDSYSRTLAEDAIAVATSTQLNFNQSNVYATIAGANVAVGAAANAFSSATIAGANVAVGTGANTVGIAAFNRANTPNIYIANSALDTMTIRYSTPNIINFNNDYANTGLNINILSFSEYNAANVNIQSYDVLRFNVSIGTASSYVIDNTVIKNPYRRFLIKYDGVKMASSANIIFGLSMNNGSTYSTIFGSSVSGGQASSNTCIGRYFINDAFEIATNSFRRHGQSFGIAFDTSFNANFTSFYNLFNPSNTPNYVNALKIETVPIGGGPATVNFTDGYVTIIGYYT